MYKIIDSIFMGYSVVIFLFSNGRVKSIGGGGERLNVHKFVFYINNFFLNLLFLACEHEYMNISPPHSTDRSSMTIIFWFEIDAKMFLEYCNKYEFVVLHLMNVRMYLLLYQITY